MRVPDEPELPASHRASAPVSLRYEDVSQDGRLMLEMLPTALGDVVWKHLFVQHPMTRAARKTGIVPILSRVVLEGGDGPISIAGPVEGHGAYALSHTVDERGEVERILLGMWCRVTGVVGRTYGSRPPNAGSPITLGRVYAEHVLTRPFAPPEQRRVVRVEAEGVPAVPEAQREWTPPESVLALPEGATPLDDALVVDPAPVVFGLDHTDSNQHVNSLVYPRLFVEATLRRLAMLGRPTQLIARFAEIAYRKPSFAGDRLRIALRAFEWDGRAGAVLALVTPEEAEGDLSRARPRCVARMLLAP
jgi:hypothetical protein